MHPVELEICFRTLEYRYNIEIPRDTPLPKPRKENGFAFLSNELITRQWLLEVLSATPLDHLENGCKVVVTKDESGRINRTYAKNKTVKLPVIQALWCLYQPAEVESSINKKLVNRCKTRLCVNPSHNAMLSLEDVKSSRSEKRKNVLLFYIYDLIF